MGPLLEQLDALIFRYLCGIVGPVGAPHGKEYAPFSGRIDLNTKVALGKSIGHEKGAYHVFTFRNQDFIVEIPDLAGLLRQLIGQVHRGTAPAKIEVILYIVDLPPGSGPVNHNVRDMGKARGALAQALQVKPVITGLGNGKTPYVDGLKIRIAEFELFCLAREAGL